MKKETYDNGSQRHTITMALGITVLVFLMLVSISGCVSFSGIPNSGSNNGSILNKSDEALKAYDKAIEINPQNTDSWNNKGDVLTKLNKSDEALKAFDKAIEINPQNADAWNNKGVALGNLNKYEDAMVAFDKSIEINPQNTDAWNNKGDALSKQNKYDEAKKAFDKAIEIDSQNSKLGAGDNYGE